MSKIAPPKNAERPVSRIEIKDVITECLNHNSVEDALFLAELNHEREKSDASLLLLCDCLLRLGRKEEVFSLLHAHDKSNARIRFLFAQVCFDLNKMKMAEQALVESPRESYLHSVFLDSPSAPFAQTLLSRILCETGRLEPAVDAARQGVMGNCLLWSPICQYLQLGGKDVSAHFSGTFDRVFSTDESKSKEELDDDQKTPVSQPVVKPVAIGAPKKMLRDEMRRQKEAEAMEPRRSTRLFSNSSANVDTENAIGGRVTRAHASHTHKATLKTANGQVPEVPVRVSSRLIGRSPASATHKRRADGAATTRPLASHNTNATSVRSLSASTASLASAASSFSSLSSTPIIGEPPDVPVKKLPAVEYAKGFRELLKCVRQLAEVEECLGVYDWAKALEKLKELPYQVSSHALAMEMHARALFESGDYEGTKRVMNERRSKAPHRVQGMEILSTALWHLQDAHELSVLASWLTRDARDQPQSWCAAGNCFSVQKQHALAVECLERAVNLDPHFGYAYSLLGHELVEMEEMDRATTAFRVAISIAPRDYRAWYGLGLVFYRREQLGLAQHNLAKAVEINSSNPVLLCQLSMVEQALNNQPRALALLEKARQHTPNNVACRYHYARLLYDMHRYDECLKELEELKKLSPDETHVYFLLGRVHKRLGHTDLALLNFSWAADMDPRGEEAHSQMTGETFNEEEYAS